MISSPHSLSREPLDLLRGKRALLVDDDDSFREFLRHFLKKNGVECHESPGGTEGLKSLAEAPVDFILSDINMPGMDGFEFLSAVRKQPQFVALPFILLTGRPAYSGLRSGLSLGADSYLPKPFDEQTLLETITNCLLRQKRLEDRATTHFNEQRVNVLKMLPHELRTPLSGILGVADLLDMGSPSEEELQEYTSILRSSGERMLRLATNFLLCAELQMGEETPERTTSIFGGESPCEARGMVEILKKIALNCGRTADIHYKVASGRISLPADALEKILAEILDNALKFSRPGDHVTVTGEFAEEFYCWQIEDHGRSGTTASMLESMGLFIQFERKINEQQGAGMGLHLVERLIANFGGKLMFSSTSGGGITVEIHLPLAKEPNLSATPH